MEKEPKYIVYLILIQRYYYSLNIIKWPSKEICEIRKSGTFPKKKLSKTVIEKLIRKTYPFILPIDINWLRNEQKEDSYNLYKTMTLENTRTILEELETDKLLYLYYVT